MKLFERPNSESGGSKGGKKKKRKRSLSSSAARPSSPPRGLKDILGSSYLTKEFRDDYLADLDAETETDTRVKWLDFWLSCRTLHELSESDDKEGLKSHMSAMNVHFFAASAKSKLVLTNPSVWKECAKNCTKQRWNDLRPFWIAQSDVTKKLDDLHADFLLQKHNNGGGGVIDKAMSCLL
jgi:hypothetical protein